MSNEVSIEKLLETRNLKRAAMIFSFLGFGLGLFLMLQEAKMLEDLGVIKSG